MKLLFLPILILTTLHLTSQEEWCSQSEIIYKIVSETGVNMRSSQTLKSKILLAIPYLSKVVVCTSSFGFRQVEVQGSQGYWLKCNFNGMIGYIHSSNMKLIQCNNTEELRISFPKDGGIDQMHNGYPISCKGNIGIHLIDRKSVFESKQVAYSDTMTNYTKLYFGSIQDEPLPYMIVHGSKGILNRGSYTSKENLFLPGELFRYQDSLNKEDIKLYCTGTVSMDSTNIGIPDYALYIIRGSQIEEVVKLNLYAWEKGIYEGGIWLKWIGDLDGDGNSEIILRVQSTYKGWQYLLLKWNGRKYESQRVGGGNPC